LSDRDDRRNAAAFFDDVGRAAAARGSRPGASLMVQDIRGNIQFDDAALADFCRRWKIQEFALFGSVLRDDFRPDSDVDVLVSLEPNHGLSLFDWVDMIDELKQLLGRHVDVVEKSTIRNPFRRHSILTNNRVVYAAGR
jgi:predicted nucleotidyltransferase